MNRTHAYSIALLFLALCAAPLAAAAADYVPSVINHQGVVRVGGEPFTGEGAFRFAIVEPDGLGYINVWTNDGTEIGTTNPPVAAVPLPVEQGLYQVDLGGNAAGMAPIVADVFAYGSTVALRIWFDDGVHGVQQLEPDQPITSAPFAHVAQYALEAVDSASFQGQQPSDFAPTGHTHTLSGLDGAVTDAQVPDDITIDHAATAGMADDSQLLDGLAASAFATTAHTHALDSLSGTLSNSQLPAEITVDRVNYTAPRTQYYAVAEPDWQPRDSATAYKMILGGGGVFVTSTGGHMMAAPIHLPHGATVTSVTVKFLKQSGHTADLDVRLRRYSPGSSYGSIAEFSTDGVVGFETVTADTTANVYRIINNIDFGYLITAHSDDWGNGQLKIMHVSIEYTLDTAL